MEHLEERLRVIKDRIADAVIELSMLELELEMEMEVKSKKSSLREKREATVTLLFPDCESESTKQVN